MLCPSCESLNLKVLATSTSYDYRIRHRRCLDCKQEIKTVEIIGNNEILRYQAPLVENSNGKKVRGGTGSKLVITPSAKYMIDHLARMLQTSKSTAF
jgi:transcriptional regulator NrdR family protein